MHTSIKTIEESNIFVIKNDNVENLRNLRQILFLMCYNVYEFNPTKNIEETPVCPHWGFAVEGEIKLIRKKRQELLRILVKNLFFFKRYTIKCIKHQIKM